MDIVSGVNIFKEVNIFQSPDSEVHTHASQAQNIGVGETTPCLKSRLESKLIFAELFFFNLMEADRVH